MGVRIRVLRCLCGKLHCAAGISPSSRCPGCSRRLWEQMWERGR